MASGTMSKGLFVLCALLSWASRAVPLPVAGAPPAQFETCNRPPPAARGASGAVGGIRANDLPDFVITGVQAPTRVHGVRPYQVAVTVCNEGRREANTEVTLFVSRDACYSEDDALLETVPTGPLAAGACVSLPVAVRGERLRSNTWFIGALVDRESRVRELSEVNNVHDGVPVTFDPPPDYVVESLSAPTVVRPGAYFEATARVCNRGGGAGAAQAWLYQSSDRHVDTGDTLVGWRFGIDLEPGACERVSLSGQVAEAGESYLAVIVATARERPEEDTSNNVSEVSALVVGLVPDYVVASLKVPAVETRDGELPVRLTVCNQGTAPAQATQVRFQIQSLESGNEGVLRVTNRDVPALAANQCAEWDELLGSSENAPGRWRLTATVNPEGAQPESHADNNDRSQSFLLGDWVELGITRVTPLTHALVPGAPFTTEVKVCNTGSRAAQRLAVHVSLSDGMDAAADVRVGTRMFDALGKGCVVLPVTGTVPSQGMSGRLYVKASAELVSPQGRELDVEDNVLVGPEVAIGSGPDLVVTQVQSSVPVVAESATMEVAVTVCNKGNEAAPSVPVWVSFLSEPDPQGLPLLVGAWRTVEPLGPGACSAWTAEPISPPFAGAWRPTAWVDEPNAIPEIMESNNLVRGEVFQVSPTTGWSITGLNAPSVVRANSDFTAAATVCNRGSQPQAFAHVRLFLRTEEGFPVAELSNGYTSRELASGDCEQVPLHGSASVPRDGGYRLVAELGASWTSGAGPERKLLSFAVPMGVGPQGGDFAVASVSAPASVRRGSAFTTSVEVCNRGTTGGSATVTAYLSRDERLETPGDTNVGQVSVAVAPGTCRTSAVRSIANVSAGDVWYVGAHVRATSSPDLVVANDTRMGARVLVVP